jgi:6-phosphogluconate dehydrogenase
VWNRSHEKTVATEPRAKEEQVKGKLTGYEKIEDFVQAIRKPRSIIILVQAGKPVDAVVKQLSSLLEKGDTIIDGGNEWYENTERRAKEVAEKGLLYMGQCAIAQCVELAAMCGQQCI